MPTISGDITLCLVPTGQQGPDNQADPIIQFIDSAKKQQRLMITVQEIDYCPIAEAIITARQHGAIGK